MTLSKRERTLSIVAGIPLVFLVLWYGYKFAFAGGSTGIGADLERANKDLETRQSKIEGLQKYREPMDDLRKRALLMEKDAENARKLYNRWLADLADKSGFEKPELVPGQPTGPRNAGYAKLPYTLRARVSLSQVTRFLHGFYSSGNLHFIKTMTLKPVARSTNLDATFSIEAMALTVAGRDNAPSSVPARKPALAALSDFRKPIDDRSFFSDPKPPVRTREAPPPADPSRYAYVTGIVGVDNKRKVYLKARTTDESFELAEGETFRIGDYRGKIKKIGEDDVDIEANDEVKTVALGDPIRGKLASMSSEDAPGFGGGFGGPPSSEGGSTGGSSGGPASGPGAGGFGSRGTRGGGFPFGPPPGGGTAGFGAPPGGGAPGFGAPPGGGFGAPPGGGFSGFGGFGGQRGSRGGNRDSTPRADRATDNTDSADAEGGSGRRSRGSRTRNSDRFRITPPGGQGRGGEGGNFTPQSAGST